MRKASRQTCACWRHSKRACWRRLRAAKISCRPVWQVGYLGPGPPQVGTDLAVGKTRSEFSGCLQVIMDIIGCLITCVTCHIILEQLTHVLAVG